jgi:hypothetical protein
MQQKVKTWITRVAVVPLSAAAVIGTSSPSQAQQSRPQLAAEAEKRMDKSIDDESLAELVETFKRMEP